MVSQGIYCSSESRPGHHRYEQAIAFIHDMPRCSLCSSLIIRERSFSGTITRRLWSKQSPSAASSFLHVKYGFSSGGVTSGHPSLTYQWTALRCGSWRVAVCSHSAITGRAWSWPVMNVHWAVDRKWQAREAVCICMPLSRPKLNGIRVGCELQSPSLQPRCCQRRDPLLGSQQCGQGLVVSNWFDYTSTGEIFLLQTLVRGLPSQSEHNCVQPRRVSLKDRPLVSHCRQDTHVI